MFPSDLTIEMARIHQEELDARGRRTGGPSRGRGSQRRRGLGEQLEVVRRRLELGRRRRSLLSQIRIGRYTGARV